MSNHVFDNLEKYLRIEHVRGEKAIIYPPCKMPDIYNHTSTYLAVSDGPVATPSYRINGKVYTKQNGEAWLIPPCTPYRKSSYPVIDGDKPFITHWCLMDFLLEPNIDLLRFFDVPYILPKRPASKLLGYMEQLSLGRVQVFNRGREKENVAPTSWELVDAGRPPSFLESVRCAEARFGILRLILEYSRPRPEFDILGAEYESMQTVLEYVQKNPSNNLSLDVLARKSSISKSAFEKKFRRILGMSPGVYVTRSRIEHACRLLTTKDMGFDEIAEACGFANRFSFSKTFKNHLGISPRAYKQRQEWQD